MSFKWDKMYKWDDNIERTMIDNVEEYVLEYYCVDEIAQLTETQIKEINVFCEEFDWNILMAPGFRYVINTWEEEQDEV